MALTTIAQVNAALPGQRVTWSKTAPGLTAGMWYSSWTVAGLPGQGVAPSSGLSGDVPTDATTGAMPFLNPAAGNTHLARVQGGLTQIGTHSIVLAVYDRLWHNSGISSTSTGAQTVNSVPLTRPDALGASVEAWWEVYVVMGSGTPTVTLAYTDQGGGTETAGTSGVLPTTMALGRTGPFSLAAGDTGVRSIQTWTASATFTSGTIGLVMRRLVALAPLPLGPATSLDALAVGLPRIHDDACLEVLWWLMAGNSFAGWATLSLAQG